MASSFASDGNALPTIRKPSGITRSAMPARKRHPAPDSVAVKIRRVMSVTRYTQQNGHRRRRQLNVLGTRYVETRVMRPGSGKILLVRRLFAVGVALGGTGEDLLGDQAGILADRHLDLCGHIRVGLEERFRVLAALPEPLA